MRETMDMDLITIIQPDKKELWEKVESVMLLLLMMV